MIAHALVGTFLGILMAYGFVGPLAVLAEAEAGRKFQDAETIKVTLLASLNGYAPAMAVEFGRKVLIFHRAPQLRRTGDARQAEAL